MDDEEITTKERAADMLLRAAYETSPLDVFNQAEDFSTGDEWKKLQRVKAGADLLVDCRLARFTGEDRTQVELTNAGRYWALSGGFLGFLKDGVPNGTAARGGGSGQNAELGAMRAHYMRLRLRTFWWTFGLSLAGFFMSLISLSLILFGREHFWK
jgi:hypothetical protein